jgi:hypothetical protein
MRTLNDVTTPNAELAKKFIETLDKVLNVYVGVFNDIFVSGYKDGQIVYREFKPWR